MARMTKQTPEDWRHVRIQPVGRKFSVRTWYLGNPFTELERAVIGVAGQETENLTLKQALSTGAMAEKQMAAMEPNGRRR